MFCKVNFLNDKHRKSRNNLPLKIEKRKIFRSEIAAEKCVLELTISRLKNKEILMSFLKGTYYILQMTQITQYSSSKIGMIKNGGNDLLSIRIFYLFLSIQQAAAVAAATVACKEPRLSHSLREQAEAAISRRGHTSMSDAKEPSQQQQQQHQFHESNKRVNVVN